MFTDNRCRDQFTTLHVLVHGSSPFIKDAIDCRTCRSSRTSTPRSHRNPLLCSHLLRGWVSFGDPLFIALDSSSGVNQGLRGITYVDR